jgi:nicotinamide-nucleotide amidase
MREREESVGRGLREAGLTIAVAESCTGGLMGSRITAVPGSSDYFLGGAIVYSNEAKETLLHVSHALLETAGAVSEAVAVTMAEQVRWLFGADIGIGITGIAGPTGYGEGKPVGLVYVALAAADGGWCERHVFESDRAGNRAQSVETALAMVERYLEEGAA